MEKITGIVLKSIDYKDSSKIVYLYTNEGKKEVIIRGAKKIKSPFRSFFLTYNIISYYPSNSKLPTLIDGDVIKTFPNILSDYKRNYYASLVLEVINNLSLENERLFSFLVSTLELINSDDYKLYTLVFLVKYLYLLGIQPQFKCLCKNNGRIKGFNLLNGHAVCEKCSDELDLNLEEIILLKNIYTLDINNDKIEYDVNILDRLYEFIFKYYNYHANYLFKVKKLGEF